MLDAVRAYEGKGYTASFAAQPGGLVLCLSCHGQARAQDVRLDALHRIEGTSDPDAMAAVLALVCPDCGAKGTLVVSYGPEASAGEALLLAGLDDRRDESDFAPGM